MAGCRAHKRKRHAPPRAVADVSHGASLMRPAMEGATFIDLLAARPSPRLVVAAIATAMPDYEIESGFDGRVAGVDEVGRGPLAGPVVAAAVVFPAGVSPDARRVIGRFEEAYGGAAWRGLRRPAGLRHSRNRGGCGVGRRNLAHQYPSRIPARHEHVRWAGLPVVPAMALVDGNQAPHAALPGAMRGRRRCAKCLSIAAASIVAKVVRDRAMARLAVRLPLLRLALQRRGYGTAAHRAAITAHGPSRHHRPTFGRSPAAPGGRGTGPRRGLIDAASARSSQ